MLLAAVDFASFFHDSCSNSVTLTCQLPKNIHRSISLSKAHLPLSQNLRYKR